jgi:hypothetical protein
MPAPSPRRSRSRSAAGAKAWAGGYRPVMARFGQPTAQDTGLSRRLVIPAACGVAMGRPGPAGFAHLARCLAPPSTRRAAEWAAGAARITGEMPFGSTLALHMTLCFNTEKSGGARRGTETPGQGRCDTADASVALRAPPACSVLSLSMARPRTRRRQAPRDRVGDGERSVHPVGPGRPMTTQGSYRIPRSGGSHTISPLRLRGAWTFVYHGSFAGVPKHRCAGAALQDCRHDTE